MAGASRVNSVGNQGAPDAHAWPWNGWQFDGSRETLVTLGIVVLETDLKLDGLEEVSLLLIEGIFKKLLHVRAHSGCRSLSVIVVMIGVSCKMLTD